jgi:threonine dehydrogenase-like Zn-dependent dehydrogenase
MTDAAGGYRERRLVLPAPGRAEFVEVGDDRVRGGPIAGGPVPDGPVPDSGVPDSGVPDSGVPDGWVRIGTTYTGLSAGTELSWFKGTNPFLALAWDAELGLFGGPGSGRPQQAYPVTRLGYMETGRVTESRCAGLPVGTRVAAAYGHATGHVADPVREHVVALPDALDPVLGVYVAHMGPICANGLLHAAADSGAGEVRSLGDGVRGRRVLVTGAGVVGLLTGVFAAHGGAAEVLVADRTADRLQVAEALGLTPVEDPREDPLAVPLAVKRRWRHGPADHGADVVFQCRGQAEALALALRCARPQATVVDLAFYPGGAGAVRLGEEFHHNGLALRCAQVARVPRGQAHLWDRARLSAETVDLLLAHGPAVRRHLVTDVLPLEQAPALLADLAARRRHVLQAVFETPLATTAPSPAPADPPLRRS